VILLFPHQTELGRSNTLAAGGGSSLFLFSLPIAAATVPVILDVLRGALAMPLAISARIAELGLRMLPPEAPNR
jgi:hypothetical protein